MAGYIFLKNVFIIAVGRGCTELEERLKTIYEQLHKMVDHIEAQAESGVKFMAGEKENSQAAPYNLDVTL